MPSQPGDLRLGSQRWGKAAEKGERSAHFPRSFSATRTRTHIIWKLGRLQETSSSNARASLVNDDDILHYNLSLCVARSSGGVCVGAVRIAVRVAPQSIQDPHILLQVALGKMYSLQLEKRAGRQQAIAARLMLRPDARDVELLCQLAQSAVKAVGELHEVLDVVDVRKVEAENVEKLRLILWQRLAGEELKQIAEVVSTMKRKPLHLQKSGWSEFLSQKVVHFDFFR